MALATRHKMRFPAFSRPGRSGPGADAASMALLEYQWPSEAVIATPTPPVARSVTWLVTALVLSMIAAMAVLPVDQVVSARGIVVSQVPTLLIQPLETAIVRSIEVREGQAVRTGDLLARLDPTFAAADLDALVKQQNSLEAEVARLQAELNGQPFAADDRPDFGLQVTIFGHRQAEFRARQDAYESKLHELRAQWTRAVSDAQAYRERLNVAEEVERMRKQLEAKQVGARINTLAATDARTEIARAYAAAQQTAEGARREIEALDSESKAFVQNWWAEASQRLTEARRKLGDVAEQVSKARLRKDLVELRAQQNGVVLSVAKVSVGSVIQSGQPFINLVPSDAPLEIEAQVPGRENGFVHVGDEVGIKFDTFPFAQFGMAEGVVRSVSPDAFNAQSEARNPTGQLLPQSADPYFRVRIAVQKLNMHDVPGGFRLSPGMPVTADIMIGERTVLSYLFGRVVPVTAEGMREP